MTSTTVQPGLAQDLAGFRQRIRELLDGFDDDTLAWWEASGHVPREAVAALAGGGIFSERWEHGAERGLPYLIALSEEISRRNGGLAIAAMGHSEMFIGGLTWLGDNAAHRALLADALAGRAVGCFSATEPQGGSNLADIRTSAARGAQGWCLRGRKRYVSNVGQASHVLVLAKMEDARHASDQGIFVVPLEHPGVRVDGFIRMVGARACDVGQITIDAELPADALLGQAGLGLAYASHLLSFERISICAQLLAGAEFALRLAASYARQRRVGGARIIDRQVIRHRLAGGQADLWNLQSRLRELTDLAQGQERMPAREIAALRLVAGETAGQIVDTCMQVLGARGCSETFPLERLWRDSRLARLGGGTDEVLADLVASAIDRVDPVYDALLSAYLCADQLEPPPAGDDLLP
jgi:alkylation response protein AidB-like acyl-CoA dehydrogenase